MKIEILDEAQEDLTQGFHFYERREPGLGSYFIACLFSDIDSLLSAQWSIKSCTPITDASLIFFLVAKGEINRHTRSALFK